MVGFPAVPASGRPWVRIVSCNPLELKDPALPPVFSGYPTGDPAGWDEFRERYRELHEPLQREFSAFCEERGAPALPELEFMHESPFLNLYLYPAEADYERSRPLGESWQRLDSCVRAVDEQFEPPPGDGALVYVSLGSLGSADVELMNRLVAALAETPHRYVVSKGPQHDVIELAPNMTGAEFLPQPAILPQADLVITHGGNNTVTESIHFGKPMVVLPLLLGSARQRPARRRGRLRRAAADLRVRGRAAARRDRPAWSRRRTRSWQRRHGGSSRSPARFAPPT